MRSPGWRGEGIRSAGRFHGESSLSLAAPVVVQFTVWYACSSGNLYVQFSCLLEDWGRGSTAPAGLDGRYLGSDQATYRSILRYPIPEKPKSTRTTRITRPDDTSIARYGGVGLTMAGESKSSPWSLSQLRIPSPPPLGGRMAYWTYLHAKTNRAIVHDAVCSLCNAGMGTIPKGHAEAGTWHGPHATWARAFNSAHAAGYGGVTWCSRCGPRDA